MPNRRPYLLSTTRVPSHWPRALFIHPFRTTMPETQRDARKPGFGDVALAASEWLRALWRKLIRPTRAADTLVLSNGGRNDGPPDLDELWRDFNRKLSGMFGGKGGGQRPNRNAERPPDSGPPFRPNLIALSLCKVVSVKDNVIEVEKIDAFEGTPVLDIKPYAPGQDSASEVRVPDWAKPK